MKVWIFQTGEPMPIVSNTARPMRAMNLAKSLVEDRNEVVVWTSTFSHQSKKFIVENRYSELREGNLEVRFIPSIGYNQNISLKRMIDHIVMAIKLYFCLKNQRDKPDVMFIGFPPILFAYVAFRWSRKNKIPVMLDVKDMWPEIFIFKAPVFLQPMLRILIKPFQYIVKYMFREAEIVSAISEGFLSWVKQYSGRSDNKVDKVFYLTPNRKVKSLESYKYESQKYQNFDRGGLRILFVGSFTNSFDFRPIIEAVKYSNNNKINWNFVLCGYGPEENKLKEIAAEFSNFQVRGAVNEAQYSNFARMADIAIAPYQLTPDFQASIPNKILDYMSFGLPIFTSLDGELGQFLRKYNCGVVYDSSDETDLVEKLSKYTQDRAALDDLGFNAFLKFNGDMSYGNVYPSMVAVMKDICK